MMALHIWNPELRKKTEQYIHTYYGSVRKKLTGRSYEHLAPRQALLGK